MTASARPARVDPAILAGVGFENLAGLSVSALNWATAAASSEVVDVGPTGGGITNTKWVLVLASGERLVMRWADPARWGRARW